MLGENNFHRIVTLNDIEDYLSSIGIVKLFCDIQFNDLTLHIKVPKQFIEEVSEYLKLHLTIIKFEVSEIFKEN
jgi:hypothetical protein